jgi:hypothetical protein
MLAMTIFAAVGRECQCRDVSRTLTVTVAPLKASLVQRLQNLPDRTVTSVTCGAYLLHLTF